MTGGVGYQIMSVLHVQLVPLPGWKGRWLQYQIHYHVGRSKKHCAKKIHIVYLLTYLLPYLSIPWSTVLLETTMRFSAIQEIPSALWDRKVHCRVYKRMSPVPVLRQISLVHATHPSHFLKIHLNIILSFTSGSSKLPLLLRVFPTKTLSHLSFFPYVPHAPPTSFSRFYHPNNICREVWSLSSSLCSFLHSSVTLSS